MSERESLLVLWGLAAQPTTGSITSNDLLQKTRDHTRNLPPLNFCLYDLPHKISIKKVAATAGSVCLLSDCGSLFSWGTSCGHGANTPTLPLKLEILSSHFITRLASGSGHFLCSTEAGVVYSWGRGNSCLGHGAGVSNLQFPTVVETLHGEVVVDVAATSYNSFAITKSKCYAWGHTGGLLGVGSPDNLGSPLPQHCPSLQGEMKGIFAGLTHVAVLVDERVYMWGSNGRGESCPTSDQNPIAIPRELESLGDGRTISSMALGNEFSLALTTDGKVFGWGANDSGQLGVGATKPTMPRVQIPALSSRVVEEVFAGRSTAACRTNNNEYFSWGINETGQLGHRDTQTWTVPRRIVTASILNDNYLSPTYLNFSLHCSLSTMAFESLSSSGETDAIGVLLHDIGSQFNEEEISDIVIQVGDQKIYASKVTFPSSSGLTFPTVHSLFKKRVLPCVIQIKYERGSKRNHFH
jgi:alpha-tubulin suppressor-like RCC1 family protein